MYFVKKSKNTDFIKQFDYLLFTAVLLLSLVGIAALKSAIGEPGLSGTLLKQILCLGIGVLMAVVISLIDYKDFKFFGTGLYIASMVMLVLVLFIGEEQGGNKSWLKVPVIGIFQPSELAKVSFAVVLPVFLERMKEGQQIGRNTIKFIIYSAMPLALVLLQRDIGTAMVFIFALIVALFIYGLPYKYFMISMGAFIAAVPLLWIYIIPKYFRHIRGRILAFLYPEADLLGYGLQVYRSKLTIGSGQLLGKGLFYGLKTHDSISVPSVFKVPYKQTDFIFAVIGEELGFIGAVMIVLIVFFILFRCIYIASNSRDNYGAYVVTIITAMLGFHFVENIGMSIGVLPVTGIPLPFMSRGGSSLITNYLNIGIVLSVSMRRKKPIFNSSK